MHSLSFPGRTGHVIQVTLLKLPLNILDRLMNNSNTLIITNLNAVVGIPPGRVITPTL